MGNKRIKNVRGSVKRLLAALTVFSLACAAAVAGVNLLMVRAAEKRILPAQEAAALDADCILVLGCGLSSPTAPSPLLADRIDAGVALYRAGAAPKLLMSGDHGRADYDEVNVMKFCAVRDGVPAEHVFMDHAGFSTYESMYRAKEIFGAKKILIVTQRYHLYRAVFIARSLGLDAYGCPAAEVRYADQLGRDIREVAARCKDFAYAVLKPLPTYLGEPISLAGSGNVTDDAHTAAFQKL